MSAARQEQAPVAEPRVRAKIVPEVPGASEAQIDPQAAEAQRIEEMIQGFTPADQIDALKPKHARAELAQAQEVVGYLLGEQASMKQDIEKLTTELREASNLVGIIATGLGEAGLIDVTKLEKGSEAAGVREQVLGLPDKVRAIREERGLPLTPEEAAERQQTAVQPAAAAAGGANKPPANPPTSRPRAVSATGNGANQPPHGPRNPDQTGGNGNDGDNGNNHEVRGRRWLRTAAVIGAVALTGVGAFFYGKDRGQSNKDQAVNAAYVDGYKNGAVKGAEATKLGSDTLGTMQDAADQQEAAAVAAAKERAKARAEARVKARSEMLSNVRDAKTVPFAAKRLLSTPDTVNSNVRWIHNNNVEKQLLHPHGEMSSIDEAFNPHTLNSTNAKELLAFSFEGSTGYAMASYQAAHGGEKTSPEAAQAWLNKKLASAEGNVRVSDALKGQVRMNHGQRGENVFAAGEFKIKGPVVLFDTGDVTLVYKLDNNGCLNLLTKIPKKTTPTTTPSTTQAPPSGNPKTKTVQGPTGGHKNPEPGKPGKPEKPVTPEKPKKGKDHTQSPVSSDPNAADERVRPNIPSPAVSIQPDGAPAQDPYTPPVTVPDPTDVGPQPGKPADNTPATGTNSDSIVTGP